MTCFQLQRSEFLTTDYFKHDYLRCSQPDKADFIFTVVMFKLCGKAIILWLPGNYIYKHNLPLSSLRCLLVSTTGPFWSCWCGFQPACPVFQPIHSLLEMNASPFPQSQLLLPDLWVTRFASLLWQPCSAFASGSSRCILSSPKLVSALSKWLVRSARNLFPRRRFLHTEFKKLGCFSTVLNVD